MGGGESVGRVRDYLRKGRKSNQVQRRGPEEKADAHINDKVRPGFG